MIAIMSLIVAILSLYIESGFKLPANPGELQPLAAVIIIIIILIIIIIIVWLHVYLSKEPSFKLSVNPDRGEANMGGTTTTTIAVNGTRYDHPVHLEVPSLPEGLEVTFNPPTVTPKGLFAGSNFSSLMVTNVNRTTPGAVYAIEIKGVGSVSRKTDSCTYYLYCLNTR
jgi:hypothetical protein